LGQGKQVLRGIQRSGGELNPEEGSRVVRGGTGDRSQSGKNAVRGEMASDKETGTAGYRRLNNNK
jgi:hypothetical protein